MTATATLEFSAPNSVSIDWGDGSTDIHAAAPDGATLTHEYPGEGRWYVTIADTVTFQRARQRVKCPTCVIGPVHITLAPSGPVNLDWTTTDPVVSNLGGQIRLRLGSNAFVVNSGDVQWGQFSATSPGGTFGPFRVSFEAVDDAECLAVVTGGNDPRRPGLDTFVLDPVLDNVSGSCFTGPNLGDKLRLRGGPGGGLAWDNATWTVDWGDGVVEHGKTITWSAPLLHEYAPPGGQTRTITVTNEQTTLSREYTGIGCPPPVTGANAGATGTQGTWTPTGARGLLSLGDLRAAGVSPNPATSWFDIGSWMGLQDSAGTRVTWDGSQWWAIAPSAIAGTPGWYAKPDGTAVMPGDPDFIVPPNWLFVGQQYGPPGFNPSSLWPTGQYVVLGDGTEMFFQGTWPAPTGWAQGRAP